MIDHDKAIYISNMDACQPSAALSQTLVKYHWQSIPYEAENVSGVMLYAGPEAQVPPVTLPVNLSGWHAVFVGLYSNWCEPAEAKLKLRLTDDPAYTSLEREGSGPNNSVDPYSLDERFWKFSDLTGQNVEFAQEVANDPLPAFVAYIKLVPLTEVQVDLVKNDRSNLDHKRLIFMNDSFSDYRTMPDHDPRQTIWDWLEPYRDTDFKTLFWCIGSGGDVLTYPSKIGDQIGADVTEFPRAVDRQVAESMHYFAGRGIDTVRTVVDYCHSMDVQVYASQRMEAFQCSPPYENFFTGSFYKTHPEWRCRDKDGREIARMSYAYEGVQKILIDIFKELANNYDIDGINPIFNRGAPFLLYEQPLVDGFKARTGLDPTSLEEDDERYLTYRADVMTEFMRTLRRCMDSAGQRRGHDIQISAHVLTDEETNRKFALDVATWVREGLIDNLVSYPFHNDDQETDVDYFVGLTKETSVTYSPDILPRRMSPEEYRQRAIKYYAAGADGLCFWDTNGRDRFKREWSMISRLGHKNELQHLDDGQGEYFQTFKMLSVGGYVLDKYPPHWAY